MNVPLDGIIEFIDFMEICYKNLVTLSIAVPNEVQEQQHKCSRKDDGTIKLLLDGLVSHLCAEEACYCYLLPTSTTTTESLLVYVHTVKMSTFAQVLCIQSGQSFLLKGFLGCSVHTYISRYVLNVRFLSHKLFYLGRELQMFEVPAFKDVA